MTDQPGQVTLELNAGDAVIIDYRLLHGTHHNSGFKRRDCLLLTFTPSWQMLPLDIRAHLVRHPAQPTERERRQHCSRANGLLPRFRGEPRDLALNRVAPAYFTMDEEPRLTTDEQLRTSSRDRAAFVREHATSRMQCCQIVRAAVDAPPGGPSKGLISGLHL